MEYQHNNITGDISSVLKSCGKFLYLVSPQETTFKHSEDVPNYFAEVSVRNYNFFLIY